MTKWCERVHFGRFWLYWVLLLAIVGASSVVIVYRQVWGEG